VSYEKSAQSAQSVKQKSKRRIVIRFTKFGVIALAKKIEREDEAPAEPFLVRFRLGRSLALPMSKKIPPFYAMFEHRSKKQ